MRRYLKPVITVNKFSRLGHWSTESQPGTKHWPVTFCKCHKIIGVVKEADDALDKYRQWALMIGLVMVGVDRPILGCSAMVGSVVLPALTNKLLNKARLYKTTCNHTQSCIVTI
jgi:hypothetical protein